MRLGRNVMQKEPDMPIHVKRAYDRPEPTDGYRVLVDRLWPRGLTKQAARIDEWAKDIAPTTGLRQWFHSRPGEWEEFQRRYRAFLSENTDKLAPLAERAHKGTVTLIYASKNQDHNNAVVLKKFMERTG